jgi:phage recombination protein Bet
VLAPEQPTISKGSSRMTVATIEPHAGSSLSISKDQDFWTDRQIAALKQLGMDGASNGDLAVFFHQAQRTGLDPFAKQIYMIGRWSREGTKYTIQTGIDGYRLISRRAADAARETLGYEDTQWCGKDGKWMDVWLSPIHPSAARVVVLRNGQRFPGIAMWSEYVQTVKSGEPNSMWSKMGAGQLAKCAEALALRKAFPQDLSGIYTVDEMGQSENAAPPRQQAPKPTTLVDAVAQHQETAAVWEQPGDPIDLPEQPEFRTEAQSKKLAILIRENKLERDEALAWMSGLIDRTIESTKELTKAEASKVIDALSSAKDAGADPVTGEVVEAELVEPEGWAK